MIQCSTEHSIIIIFWHKDYYGTLLFLQQKTTTDFDYVIGIAKQNTTEENRLSQYSPVMPLLYSSSFRTSTSQALLLYYHNISNNCCINKNLKLLVRAQHIVVKIADTQPNLIMEPVYFIYIIDEVPCKIVKKSLITGPGSGISGPVATHCCENC